MASHSHQRHLKELLKEDQEPFFLTTYLSDRQSKLNLQPSVKKHQASFHNLQVKKKKHQQNAPFPSRFCKNACFFSADSPDYLRRSPLFSPAMAAKSPSHALFFHVPAKTAALLLEAAMKIHKTPSTSSSKTRFRKPGFGLLGSVIKRVASRVRTRKLGTGELKAGAQDDVVMWADSVEISDNSDSRRSSFSKRDDIRVGLEAGLDLEENEVEAGFSNGRLSSVWSEENKSLVSSSSSSSSSSSRIASGNLTPVSPSPAFSSPVKSPSRRRFQDDPSAKLQAEDEEEEKEQCSPVSILDPPFGDEEEGGGNHDEEDEFDIERSYAFVQRAKQQLLHKLSSFEKLAELDPNELEKRMIEDQPGVGFEDLEYSSSNYIADLSRSHEDERNTTIRKSIAAEDLVNPGMKRLLSDLILEEERAECWSTFGGEYESVVKRVGERLKFWREVEADSTIDMLVAVDLRRQGDDDWMKMREEVSDAAKTVEFRILEELLDELIM